MKVTLHHITLSDAGLVQNNLSWQASTPHPNKACQDKVSKRVSRAFIMHAQAYSGIEYRQSVCVDFILTPLQHHICTMLEHHPPIFSG